MSKSKQVIVRLFLNTETATYYVQIGQRLYATRASVACSISEKEQIEIIHANDLKDMQQKSNEG